jgi:hypothetical protein
MDNKPLLGLGGVTIVAGLSMSRMPDFEGLAMFTKVAEERSYPVGFAIFATLWRTGAEVGAADVTLMSGHDLAS